MTATLLATAEMGWVWTVVQPAVLARHSMLGSATASPEEGQGLPTT